jgi:hypothetical protein
MGALSSEVGSLQNATFSGIALFEFSGSKDEESLLSKAWHTIWSRAQDDVCSCMLKEREFGGEGSVVVEEREDGRESRAHPFM